MGEWKEYRLKELADVQTGPFGSQLHQSDYKMFGTPIITVEHLAENKILHQNLPLVSDEDKNRLNKYVLQEGDIVFSRVGSVDRRAYVSKKENGWMFSGRCLRVRSNKRVVDPKYLSYYFGQESFKEHIRMIAVGATMPSINTEILSHVDITCPPLPEQKSIASILSSLDDKIDLLHRQNKTLEALAETLFRQWFVEEAEERWEETKIGNVLRTELGGTPSTKKPEYWDGDVPWINSGEVNNFRINKASKFITALGLKESNTKLMPKGTVVLAITGATLGQISILEIDACANQSVVGIIPNEDFPMEFVFLWIKLKIKEIISNQTGGAQQHINKDDVNETPIIIPSKALMKECMPTLSAHFNKISSNINQIRTLTRLRDTLLPKLMSGEVRVKEG